MTNMPLDFADVIKDLGRGFDVMSDRELGYRRGRDYAEGEVNEVTVASKAMRKILKASAEAHKVSFAHIPIEALFDKINLTSISIDKGDETPAGKLLAKVWADNDLEDEADDWHRRAGTFGDYYVIIDPVEEDAGGNATEYNVVGASPLTAAVVYERKNSRKVRHGVRRWQDGDHWEAIVYYDDATVALTTAKNVEHGDDASKYEPDYDVDDDGVIVPGSHVITHKGGRPLIIHLAIDGKPYGKPVHRKAFGAQDAINKQHATWLASVDYQGFPQRYALAHPDQSVEDDDLDEDFGNDGLPVDADHPVTGTGGDAQLTPTTGTSQLRGEPGSTWLLKGIKDVGQFEAADTDNFLKGLDWEVRAMSTATGTPFFEFDESGNPPSGASRRLANGRINKHAGKVQRSLARSWRTFAETVIAVSGAPVGAEVKVGFDPIETETDAEGMALVKAKIEAGVPVYTALTEAGYTTEEVAEWWPENDNRLPPALWVTFADFLSKMGTAMAGGAISGKELSNLVPDYLTAPRENDPAPEPAPAPTPPPSV